MLRAARNHPAAWFRGAPAQRLSRSLVLAAFAVILGGAPGGGESVARAAEVRVRSQTIGEGYMVRRPGTEVLYTRRRLAQYVNLGVFDLLPPDRADRLHRDPDEGQLSLVTSMRLRHDFGTFRSERGVSSDLVDANDGRQIDLLYGYLEGRRLGGWVDLRAGRQFEMSGLDWYVFDGGSVRVNTPAHLALDVFGGFQVKGEHLFGYPTYELDGTAETPEARASSPMVGAGVALSDLSVLDARIAYRRTFTPASLARDIAVDDGTRGLETAVDQELVSATAAMHLAKDRLTPYAAARYNLGTARLDELGAGLHWAFFERDEQQHALRVQYLRTQPSFDLDSIFNVFSIQGFDDLRVSYQVSPGSGWTVMGRGQLRLFEQRATGTLGEQPESTRGYGGGLSAAYTRPRFSMRLDGHGLGGEGGLRAGGSADTRTAIAWGRLAIDARIYYLYFADDAIAERRGSNLALQLGLHVPLWKTVSLDAVGEEMFSPYVTRSFRTLLMLTADWRIRGGRR